jgi:hypothetical protein
MATTLSCPIPSNITPLSPNGFMFNISKLPDMSYFCQQVNLPGVTVGSPEFGNPFNSQPIPGDSLTYDQLTVQFLVDSDMRNYKAIYNWIIALGFPQSYEQYVTFINQDERGALSELARNYSDATLQILSGTNVPTQIVQFHDLFPVSLDSIAFESTNQDVQYVVGNATFRYGYYKFL